MGSTEEFKPHRGYPLGDEDADGCCWVVFERIKEDDVQLVIDNISNPEHRARFESLMCRI